MSTYKVIQDIEAEDKLLGPLTLRQFIYAAIAAVCLYLCFIALKDHIQFLILAFLPIALVCAFFAFPFGRDQPTELWALAKIRFMLKPHKRIWNQSGIKELVTVTAPRQNTHQYTDGLSRDEVQSRLKALATTIDTRGWATKNINVNLYQTPTASPVVVANSDRLVKATSLPQDVPTVDVQPADDVLDEKNNPTAYNLNQMITSSTVEHRKQVVDEVNKVASGQPPSGAAPDYWFLNQTSQSDGAGVPRGYATFDTRVVTPGKDDNVPKGGSTTPPSDPNESEEEKKLNNELKSHHEETISTYREHMKVIEPIAENAPVKSAQSQPAVPVTQAPDPAILALAGNNDLNVATIARQANKSNKPESSQDEVVITLH
jgi:hypothetical protein